jgi:hypothetical protein
MGWLGLTMVAETPWIGVPALACCSGCHACRRRLPVAPLVLLAAVVVGITTGQTTMPAAHGASTSARRPWCCPAVGERSGERWNWPSSRSYRSP